MACSSCGQRRVLSAQAFNNLRKGDLAAARTNAHQIISSVRSDIQRFGQAVRSPILSRPPIRPR